MHDGLPLQWGGAQLVALPDRALWWPEQDTLLVADVHVGKAQSFRRLGVPVPDGTTDETLARLSTLIDRLGAQRLVVLGDWTHSARGLAASQRMAVARWRERHAALDWHLVEGNHDARSGRPPAEWRLQLHHGVWSLGPLDLSHEPVARPGRPVVSGHVHPCVHVGRGVDRLRLPCFHFQPQLAVLPAFGAFTGAHAIRPQPADRVLVIAEGSVRELPR